MAAVDRFSGGQRVIVPAEPSVEAKCMRYRFAVPLAMYSSSTYPLLVWSSEVAPNGTPAPAGRLPGYRSKPRSALLATALLAFAGRTLAAGSDNELIEAMRPFVAGPGAQGCRQLWRWRMPPLVGTAVRAVMRPRAALRRR